MPLAGSPIGPRLRERHGGQGKFAGAETSTESRREALSDGSAWQCGAKRYCSEMTSCAEARYYLTQCGVRSLDRDGDGVPCEALCRQGEQ